MKHISRLTHYQLVVFFVVGILTRPDYIAAQRLNNTIPNVPSTPIVEIELGTCPRLVFLPIIGGSFGQGEQANDSFTDAQVQRTDYASVADDAHDAQELTTIADEVQRKLEAVAVLSSTIVFTEATSLWADPSPDPSGIDSFGDHRIIISDSEVNEQPGRTKNVWIFDLNLRQVLSSTSTFAGRVSAEPTDIALVGDGTFLITDDVKRRIISAQFDLVGNIQKLYSFDTTVYGSADPEAADVFVMNNERVLVTGDARGNMIYIHRPGDNQRFDGPCAPGDDTVRQFNTAELGFLKPAGIYAVPDGAGDGVTYYVVGEADRQHIYVLKANATSVQLAYRIDIGELSVYHKMAGIVVLANSHIVLIFRGVDNDSDPDENDGVLAVLQPIY